MYLHALTDQVPKTIYVNKEQSPKPRPEGSLTQASIDQAFRRPARVSKYVWFSPDARYILLSGKNTGRLEVSSTILAGSDSETVETTKIERTLIDICVRPSYAGGIFEVLTAYSNAMSRVSINTLLAVLKKLDYVYPYHQAIGFYMQRAGYPERQLVKLEGLGKQWKFYLDYKLDDPAYDERWMLFYPKGF